MLTIGYGHRVRGGESFSTLTLSEAHELLLKDVSYVCRGVNSMTNATLLQRQYDVIVSFVFNVGLGAYQRSTLRSKVNRGEHELVQGEFRKWIYIGTQHSKGLIKRRNIEANMYMIAS